MIDHPAVRVTCDATSCNETHVFHLPAPWWKQQAIDLEEELVKLGWVYDVDGQGWFCPMHSGMPMENRH